MAIEGEDLGRFPLEAGDSMTVNWNSRKGFSGGPSTASSADEGAAGQGSDTALLAELQLAMRKVPDTRATVVARGKKLLADPKYPSCEVLRQVARHLARNWDKSQMV
jgi:hypothetical protein